MNPALVVKLRPTTPWRVGPDSGTRNRVDPVYHSDSLYSAVTSAMLRLGLLEEWLDATARNAGGSAVRFSSCFPFVEEIGYIAPPRTLWPPMGGAPLVTPKVRWRSARFVPLGVVQALSTAQVLDEEHWIVDGMSQCLLPVGRQGPFRTAVRAGAAVDRLSGASERHATACLEFRQGAGLWTIVSFAGGDAQARWADAVRGAFRLLADSGFGGERSRGWGKSADPEFIEGELPQMILPASEPAPETREGEGPAPENPAPEQPRPHWLLSLFTPGPGEPVDWTRGNYSVLTRGGRVESPVRWGDPKKQLNMVAEGSVLISAAPLLGSAPDVAPDGLPHPVFRAGFAVSIPLPAQVAS